MLMHKILQNHLLCAFVANLKNDAIYGFHQESFCDKNLAIRKVFAFSDSEEEIGEEEEEMMLEMEMTKMMMRAMVVIMVVTITMPRLVLMMTVRMCL